MNEVEKREKHRKHNNMLLVHKTRAAPGRMFMLPRTAIIKFTFMCELILKDGECAQRSFADSFYGLFALSHSFSLPFFVCIRLTHWTHREIFR